MVIKILTACKFAASPVSLDVNTPIAWLSSSYHPHSWRINAANVIDLQFDHKFHVIIICGFKHFNCVYLYYRSRRTKFEPALAKERDWMIAATNKMIPRARNAEHSSTVRACASASSFIANAYAKKISFYVIKFVLSTVASTFEYILRRLQRTK